MLNAVSGNDGGNFSIEGVAVDNTVCHAGEADIVRQCIYADGKT